ncbi:hypothetical protein LTR86_003279 [Recurvomyces mirabilis]|nr:hypothetical protein LTR86_003279 [Recurvomyces mirabilis]
MASPFTATFDGTAKDTLEFWHIPGASFAVLHGAKSWTRAYGHADQESKIPTTSETLFYAASTTKAHLCAAWGVYIDSDLNRGRPEKDQIKWSTPLAEIIREDFVLADCVRTAQVTLEDALSHRTGLPSHELSYGYDGVKETKSVTRNLRNLPLSSSGFRTTLDYCNTPFIAASHALEVLTGRPMAAYLGEMLWKPLGMTQTFPGYPKATEAVKDRGMTLAKGTEEHQDFPEISGAGYVISNANDYIRWMRAWLEPGSGPLRPELIKEVWTSRTIAPPDDAEIECIDGVLAYGLGWYINMYRGCIVYWHPGGLIGAGSYIMLCPDIHWGVTLFANGEGASFKIKSLAFELLDVALGIPEKDRTMRRRCQDRAVKAYPDSRESQKRRREELCPSVPADRKVPLAVPLSAYTGHFSHPGYGPLTFKVVHDTANQTVFHLDLTNRTWRDLLVFEHANAEHWLVEKQMGQSPLRTILRAESRIGVDGTVVAWGIAMEPSLPDTLMWFDRVMQ